MKVLFVCYANLCRSPLAEVISQSLFSGRIEARSAGVAPGAGKPFEEAIDVAKRFYKCNIARHRPRHVLDFPADDFDYIIALDSTVFMRLAGMPEIPDEKLYGWEIPDPAGLGVETYEKVARLLENEIEKFLELREREALEAGPS
ncbi:MAG: low molecular weight phosphatase family protein [Candidatus Aminicenantes bacterium]|nr:low molecular weight phosphatase family protein [Candidatus Aminicenantes bacterium]